jgi:hydrogenase maturation factor HypF (carbamoyltransferase family)
MPNPQNLRKPTSEEAKEMQKKSVEKRKENKTMREIYEEVIANKKNEIVKALNKGIEEGNLATLKELREGTDGNKINLSGSVKTEMETTEERVKAFESIVGK